MPDRLTVTIASYLEPEQVERIRRVAPDRVRVLYDPTLLPTPRYHADHHPPEGWTRPPEDEARFWSMVAEADVLWDFPVRSEGTAGGTGPGGLLARAPKLRWIQTTSSGVGPRVVEHGLAGTQVLVSNAAGMHTGPLSEFTMLALLMHVKELNRIQRMQAEQRFEKYATDELEGKTLAIIGLGEVGRRIAKLAQAFGMRTVGVTARPSPERTQAAGLEALYPPGELHRALAQADAVVLILPHTPQTENLFDRQAFAALKPGTVFINIARGAVVDEAALLEALRNGTIGFAALDVFATEPLPPGHPLWTEPKVLCVPHSASTAFRENERLTDRFCHNLRCLLEARPADMQSLMDTQTL